VTDTVRAEPRRIFVGGPAAALSIKIGAITIGVRDEALCRPRMEPHIPGCRSGSGGADRPVDAAIAGEDIGVTTSRVVTSVTEMLRRLP
jgi:hypothetical protein